MCKRNLKWVLFRIMICPGKRRQWSDESMREVVEYVREEDGRLREAARLYGTS